MSIFNRLFNRTDDFEPVKIEEDFDTLELELSYPDDVCDCDDCDDDFDDFDDDQIYDFTGCA